ncbi:hypothetical protein ACVGVM_18070 [Pseudonocardia bannensis]|uniref:Uncharacterized protein n=1 Tax=Pseudonocardia bannensis TaxID=630973 RepID=A0A848DP25_9PSEU|nr:hypothetical protein [Pseudonocardia bannensis]NMH94216.1 hypothetical protein [Pseudonocardia bannensis]
MNRIALHQSTAHPMPPVELVDVARRSGIDSIGLRVGGVGPGADEVQQWRAPGCWRPVRAPVPSSSPPGRRRMRARTRPSCSPPRRSWRNPARPCPGCWRRFPPQVAVAIGDPDGGGAIGAEHVARVSALRAAVDGMLPHPRAAGTP